MKTFNKVFGGLILAFGWMVAMSLHSSVSASVVARSPKTIFVSSYTTGAVQITPNSSTTISGITDYLPGAVYQVILGTGVTGEYYELWDSTGAAGITCTGGGSGGANQLPLGPKLLYNIGSTSMTIVTFDPPMLFRNGLVGCDSSSAGQIGILYEQGRGLSGN